MKQNQYYSYNLNDLPQGCQYCVKGEKLVLFVTGLCPKKCYFCPVSDEKFGSDLIFANERRVLTSADVIKEAELMQAKGAGITGGDPLLKVDRCVRFIKSLKKRFGKEFHIHLYTPLRLVNDSSLQKLFQVGLDEIRFHFDLDSKQFWERIEIAQKFPWDVGVEIPLIPGKEKEIKSLVDYIQGRVVFLNLNELEVADNSQSKLLSMGFKTRSKFSYTIVDSLELGLKIIDYVQDNDYKLKVHLCTAKLKDATQLSERIKRESSGVKKDFDYVDEEGLLTRGALYFDSLKPDFDYRKNLGSVNLKKYVDNFEQLIIKIKTELGLKDNELYLDISKPRILLSRKNAQKYKKEFVKMGLVPAIVTEYPTADQLEIEVKYLK